MTVKESAIFCSNMCTLENTPVTDVDFVGAELGKCLGISFSEAVREKARSCRTMADLVTALSGEPTPKTAALAARLALNL
jgi:hypothetical protein